jgi:hypothetical protein
MQQNTSGQLWLEWMVATLIGYVAGALVVLPLAVQLAYAALPPWLVGGAGGAALGGLVGIAQWLVMRRSGKRTSGWWVPAGLVGGMLGLALGTALGDMLAQAAPPPVDREAAARMFPLGVALSNGITGALFGLFLGGAQWLALRRPRRVLGWWALANGLGWAAGMGLGAVVAAQGNTIAAMLITGAVSGAITAVVMQRWIWPAVTQA